MEELKPCLLPCNLEQLNDRINNLGIGIARMGENDTIRVHKAFLVATLGYMEELFSLRYEDENRRAAPENKPLTDCSMHFDKSGCKANNGFCIGEKCQNYNPPLTLEELRGMEGNLVWLTVIQGHAIECKVIAKFERGRAYFTDEEYCEMIDYGITWLAYAHKPEK